MVTVERNVYIVSDTGGTAEVIPVTPDFESTHKVPIVDTTIRHDDEHTGNICALTVRDALSVPAMGHNLIPPFTTRKGRINARTTPKFQVEDLSIDYHSVYFPMDNLRMTLKLHGMFSYFPKTKPSINTLKDSDQVLLLTPDGDFEGNLIEKKDRVNIIISDIGSSKRMEIETVVSEHEMTLIDKLYHQEHSGIDSVDGILADLLVRDDDIRNYEMSIRSYNKMVNEHLDDTSISTTITEAMTEDLSIGDDIEDVTDSDLEIESLMGELDSVIK